MPNATLRITLVDTINPIAPAKNASAKTAFSRSAILVDVEFVSLLMAHALTTGFVGLNSRNSTRQNPAKVEATTP